LRSIWENDQIYSTYYSDFTTATHIVFVYSLLLAIQHAKVDLVQRASRGELAEDERETLAVFRQRGSQFLILAAVGSAIEIVLARPIADRFSLNFGSEISPKLGRELWKPVVEAMLPFANCLGIEGLKGSLRNQARVDEAIGAFRSIIRSTARGNQAVFADFATLVTGS